MDAWRDISTAPTNGSRVWVKRVYNGELVAEGWSVWGIMAANAPIRMTDDGEMADDAYADQPRWLREERLYAFPEPTHWNPTKTVGN